HLPAGGLMALDAVLTRTPPTGCTRTVERPPLPGPAAGRVGQPSTEDASTRPPPDGRAAAQERDGRAPRATVPGAPSTGPPRHAVRSPLSPCGQDRPEEISVLGGD
ncbi:MAG: hypothetical protein ACRDRT_09650, partial [Pseudonocardiaceae bacterium]